MNIIFILFLSSLCKNHTTDWIKITQRVECMKELRHDNRLTQLVYEVVYWDRDWNNWSKV